MGECWGLHVIQEIGQMLHPFLAYMFKMRCGVSNGDPIWWEAPSILNSSDTDRDALNFGKEFINNVCVDIIDVRNIIQSLTGVLV